MGLLATLWAMLRNRKTKPVTAATKPEGLKPEGLKPEVEPAHAWVPTCALVVGHSARDGGAVSIDGWESEYEFNMPLAQMIAAKVPASRCRVRVVLRETNLASLVAELNKMAPDFVVELHCNAADNHASGTEMLYGDLRPKAEIMARIIQRHVVAELKLPDRGVKARAPADRGGYLLHKVTAPAVIAESFFIDNPKDLQRARDVGKGLAQAYAQAITSIAQAVLTREEGPEQ